MSNSWATWAKLKGPKAMNADARPPPPPPLVLSHPPIHSEHPARANDNMSLQYNVFSYWCFVGPKGMGDWDDGAIRYGYFMDWIIPPFPTAPVRCSIEFQGFLGS